MVLFTVSINGFSIFVLAVGWIHVCLYVTQNFLKIVLQPAKCQSLLMRQKHPPDISLFPRIMPIYLFKTLLALTLLLFLQLCVLHKTVEDQDHNSGLHSQVLINDSRLNIINVYQDSRRSVQDTSLLHLTPSMHEQFLSDFGSDDLTQLSAPWVCESHPPKPHDTTINRLYTEADVSCSSLQEYSTVTFKASNIVSFM